MLANPQHIKASRNPFSYRQEQEQEPKRLEAPLIETHKLRNLRHAGNVCDVVSGTALNSSIVFTFHLMQVHPVGLLLAVGVSHFYFTATAVGEGTDHRVTNVMIGASSSLAILCAAHEPLMEWIEAQQSREAAIAHINSMYPKTPQFEINYGLLSLVVLVFISVGILWQKKR